MIGYVYAVESGDAVKIGWAKDPVRRLSELRVGSPVLLRLVGVMKADRMREKEIHAACDKWRIRGEWFKNEGAVLSFIERLESYPPTLKHVGAALEKAKVAIGGNTALAQALGGLTPQAVSQWRRVPAERTLDVERVTGVSRHELRPDLYPLEYPQ
jgi:hypothetical protein